MASYATNQWRLLGVIGVLMAGTAGVAALQPLPMKVLVDYGLRGETGPGWLPALPPAELILLAGILSIAVFLVQTALDSALTMAWSVAGQRMVVRLSNDLFAKLLRLNHLYHGKNSVGDSISRLTGDTWCVYTFISGFVMGPIQQILVLASVAMFAFSLDASLAWVSVAMAPALALSSYAFGGRLKQRAKQGRKADANLLSFVQQTLTALPLVQAFAAEDRNQTRFGSLADDAIRVSKKGALLSSSLGMVNGLITTTGTCVVLFYGGQRVFRGQMQLGTLLVFLTYMRSMHAGVESLLKLYGGFKPLEASIDRVAEVLSREEYVPDPPAAEPFAVPASGSGHVVFQHVTFAYGSSTPVLQDISLEVQPGETLALVGRTGAGKSTLAALIPRLIDPGSGVVTIDGRDLRTARVKDVRAHVSLLLQEPFLFPVSIAENIRLGRPDASLEEVIAAAKAAEAHAFIQAFPQGYDTVLGERGATLSGGERQRIAIARAFLRNAPILILDEPSSALDARTEQALMDAVTRLMEGRTTIIIAHRLSTIRRADKIVVLEEGRIVETGTHQQLLQAQGAYARYHKAQFSPAKVSA